MMNYHQHKSVYTHTHTHLSIHTLKRKKKTDSRPGVGRKPAICSYICKGNASVLHAAMIFQQNTILTFLLH